MTLWLMLNTAVPSHQTALAECRARHRSDTEMSVNRSELLPLALVKVAGADGAWLASRGWPVVSSHDRATHGLARALVQAPAWRNPPDDASERLPNK